MYKRQYDGLAQRNANEPEFLQAVREVLELSLIHILDDISDVDLGQHPVNGEFIVVLAQAAHHIVLVVTGSVFLAPVSYTHLDVYKRQA